MGFFKRLFEKKDYEKKYNIKPQENQPQKVYGVLDVNMYDINKNMAQKIKEDDKSNQNEFNKTTDIKDKCFKIMGPDPFWGELLNEYMNSLNYSDDKKMELLTDLEKDQNITNEFSKYLINKNYDYSNAMEVNGKTAKEISEENPELTAIEVYIELIKNK